MARRKSDSHVNKRQRTAPKSRFDALLTAVEKMDIAQDFLEIPPKKYVPDYFDIIKDPISLQEIKGKNHTSAKELVADFELMADNANTYNDPKSEIAKDSVKILQYVKGQLKKELKEEEEAEEEKRRQEEEEEEKRIKEAEEEEERKRKKPALPKIKLRAPGTPQSTPQHHGHTTQKQKYLNVLDEIMTYKVDGVNISEPFMHEVNRKDYPDYYRIIKKVTSLSTVKENLVSGRIKSMGQFINQMELVFRNAQTYNDEGSLLYQDSKTLQDYFHSRMDEIKKEIEEQQRLQHEQQLAMKKTSTPPVKLKIKPPVKFNLAPVGPPEDDLGESYDDFEPSKDHHIEEENDGKEDNEEKEEGVPVGPSTRPRTLLNVADQLIQEITITSSRSQYKQAVRPMNNSPIPPTYTWFEHHFKASEFKVQSHTMTLNRSQSAISISAKLNGILMEKRHQSFLTVNGERVNPTPSIHYAESGKLTSRYELKLPLGLSMVVFDVVVDNNNEQRRAVENKEKSTIWIQVV